MSNKSNGSFRWLNLSALILALLASAFSINAQQIVSENGGGTNDATSGNIKSDKKTKEKAAPAPSSTYNWSGFYVGGQVGYGWGKGDTKFEPLPDPPTFVNLAPTTIDPKAKGAIIGGYGGYNWQAGHLVVGAVADFNWSNLDKSVFVTPITQNNGTPFTGGGSLTTRQKIKWHGTVRPRVGVAFDRVLIYGTAGLAYASISNNANTDFHPFGTVEYPAPAQNNRAKMGWTAGGGVEIGINKHFSIKSEYLYYDFGKQSAIANPIPALPPFQVKYTWENKLQSWNTGVTFRF
jgi:outer membrane immunogenic protein